MLSRSILLAALALATCAVPLTRESRAVARAFRAPSALADSADAAPPGRAAEGVRAFVDRYLAVLEERDEAAVRALYVDDERFAWFTDGALAYTSPDGVLAGLRQYAGVRFATTASDVRALELAPELAAASFAFRTELTIPRSDGHSYEGVVTLLLERASPAAPWRVLQGHTSTPSGPPRVDGEARDAEGAAGR